MKNGIKISTLIKFLVWLILLAMILVNNRYSLLWVYGIITVIVLIINAVSHDDTASRNAKRNNRFKGIYTKDYPGGKNVYTSRSGSPADSVNGLYQDVMNRAADAEEKTHQAN